MRMEFYNQRYELVAERDFHPLEIVPKTIAITETIERLGATEIIFHFFHLKADRRGFYYVEI